TKLGDHAVGVGAANVVALEQDLAAAADTHEFVAESVEARGGSARAEHRHGEETEKRDVEKALTHGRLRGALRHRPWIRTRSNLGYPASVEVRVRWRCRR